jgi:adenylate kinase
MDGELRVALADLRSLVAPIEECIDIEKQVVLHAQTAYTIAVMEHRPPGYTTEMWALHLMDKTRSELQARLIQRVEREKERLGPMSVQQLLLRPMSLLPSLPSRLPPELAPKMIQLDREWTKTLFERKAREALSGFVTKERDASVFRRAQAQLQQVYSAMAAGVGGRLPFSAKLHMTSRGDFKVQLEDRQ